MAPSFFLSLTLGEISAEMVGYGLGVLKPRIAQKPDLQNGSVGAALASGG